MKYIVCGGRDYRNISAVRHALGAVHERAPITLIIEGGALGADRLAREWAIANNVPFVTCEADWEAHGKRAGPLRNRQMIVEGKPDGVIAFPGGGGTANMIEQARTAGIKIWQPFG